MHFGKSLFRLVAQVLSVLQAVSRRTLRVLRTLDATRLLVLGYLSYVLLGWAALSLAISQQQPAASSIDHLFTSVSAVSTTGLVTVSTSDSYSGWGEVVVLWLIQLGGLGYMTASSFIVLGVSGQLSPFRERVSQSALSLPSGFELKRFLRVTCCFTLLIESIGALALYPSFLAHGATQPVWQAIFHSVSAFSTAGFGLFNNSLEDYRDDTWLNFVVAMLSYLGAIGFIVLHDLWMTLTQRRIQVTLTSKIILWSTASITLLGTLLFALDETSIAGLPFYNRWMAACFQVMSASTTVGFNTISISALTPSSVYLLTVIMVIGASPAGTGGGLKTTTFSVLWAEMISVVLRRKQTTFFGRIVPEVRRRAAVANVMFYTLMLVAGIYALALVDRSPLPDQMFECASAIGTVGLSRGITGTLSTAGKIVVILLMFVGRVGPVIIGMSFFQVPSAVSEMKSPTEEDVAI